jgi:hypothetical protein
VDVVKYSSPFFGILFILYGVELNQVTCVAPQIACNLLSCPRNSGCPSILWPYLSGVALILLAVSLWALPNPSPLKRHVKGVRLAVLGYLTFLVGFWIARILALVGNIAVPLGFGAVGVQADDITARLFIASGIGIVGLKILNGRLRP